MPPVPRLCAFACLFVSLVGPAAEAQIVVRDSDLPNVDPYVFCGMSEGSYGGRQSKKYWTPGQPTPVDRDDFQKQFRAWLNATYGERGFRGLDCISKKTLEDAQWKVEDIQSSYPEWNVLTSFRYRGQTVTDPEAEAERLRQERKRAEEEERKRQAELAAAHEKVKAEEARKAARNATEARALVMAIEKRRQRDLQKKAPTQWAPGGATRQ